MAPVHKRHKNGPVHQVLNSNDNFYESDVSSECISLIGSTHLYRKPSSSSLDTACQAPSDESSIRDEEEDQITDLTVSESSSNSPRDPNSKVSGRSPNCAACRNHGTTVALKGHKRHCRYKECHCSKCQLTFKRRKIMASSVKMTRELKQDMEQGQLPVSEPTPGSPKGYSQLESAVLEGKIPLLKAGTIEVGHQVVKYDEDIVEGTVKMPSSSFLDLIERHQNLWKRMKQIEQVILYHQIKGFPRERSETILAQLMAVLSVPHRL